MTAMDFATAPINGQMTPDGRYQFDTSVGSAGAWRATPIPAGGLPAGSIIQWSTNTAPANWLLCDGSAVSRSTYPSLYAAIGTTYGAGDGSTTFNLPDLRGRVPVGKNSGTFGTLGATGGAETVTLSTAEMPSHSHPASNSQFFGGASARTTVPTGSALWTFASNSLSDIVGAVSTGNTGGGGAHNNLQPYLVTNYIIKATAGWSAGDSELAQRVGVLEAAPAGLVRVMPTSVAVTSGTASVSSTGIVTINGAASISLENVFSSTFSNYRLNVSLTSNSTLGDALGFRFRKSGTTNSTGVYTRQGVYMNATTVVNYSDASNTSADALMALATGKAQATIDIFQPYSGVRPGWLTNGVSNHDSGTYAYRTMVGGTFRTADSFESLNIYVNGSGTVTGTIQVYGYRN